MHHLKSLLLFANKPTNKEIYVRVVKHWTYKQYTTCAIACDLWLQKCISSNLQELLF